MVILRETEDAQVFKIVPRLYNVGVSILRVRNDSTNTVSEYEFNSTTIGNYSSLSGVISLKKDTFYDLEVYNSADGWDSETKSWQNDGAWTENDELTLIPLYKDRIFCTNQDDYERYTVNKDGYVTENTHDNDYILF
jgi:hypothetical protein